MVTDCVAQRRSLRRRVARPVNQRRQWQRHDRSASRRARRRRPQTPRETKSHFVHKPRFPRREGSRSENLTLYTNRDSAAWSEVASDTACDARRQRHVLGRPTAINPGLTARPIRQCSTSKRPEAVLLRGPRETKISLRVQREIFSFGRAREAELSLLCNRESSAGSPHWGAEGFAGQGVTDHEPQS
jgi:hypothetical protein